MLDLIYSTALKHEHTAPTVSELVKSLTKPEIENLGSRGTIAVVKLELDANQKW